MLRHRFIKAFSMKKYILFSIVIISLGFGSCRPAAVVVAPPPAPVVKVRPNPPSAGYVWVSGNYVYRGGRYVYREGYWAMPPSRGQHYVDGYWKRHRGRYVWVPGYWR